MQIAEVDRRETTDGPERKTAPAGTGAFAQILKCDFYRGFVSTQLWMLLGWSDIRLRYRRSVIGPFWITLSMAVLVAVLGVIYSKIFHTEIRTYLPYLALGFITWGFIAASINESCSAFQDSERIIKQVGIPLSVFVFRVVWRNFIVLLHTIVLVVPIWLIFSIVPSWASLLAIPGMALVFLNQCWIGVFLAVISTRYRDVPQIVATGLQITIFATPIMWPVSSLGDHRLIADINPVYHFIEITRAPLIGQRASLLSWEVAALTALAGTICAALLLERKRRRVVYWL